jgi:DNA/RNA-binding domain of Phe-tRNA-synthetase-like protein
MENRVAVQVSAPGIAVGWVVAEGCQVSASPETLVAEIRQSVAKAVASKDSPESVARKAAVRDMLRHGTYRPTGRGKPASEYLLNAASEGQFPFMNNLVDINNLASIETLLPISLVDLDRAGSDAFRARRGREGEQYVFNPSGQVLDLRDLLLVSRLPADIPCATPIKDCQETKTHEGTRRVIALIYAPSILAGEAAGAARRMAGLIRTHGGGSAESGVVEA